MTPALLTRIIDCAKRCEDLVDQPAASGFIAYIGSEGHRACAGVCKQFLRSRWYGLRSVEGNLCACFCQCKRNAGAEAA